MIIPPRPAVILVASLLATQHVSAQETTGLSGPYFGQTPPGDVPVLFAPEFFLVPRGHHATVVFSPDGREAYWTPIGIGRGETARMSRMEEGLWTLPQRVDFGMDAPVTEVALSPDGSRVFFLSRKRVGDDSPVHGGESRPERIWYASRTGDGVGVPRLAPAWVNAHAIHWQFSVAWNGDLFFASEPADRTGSGGDIYVARFDGHDYSEPEALDRAINSEYGENCPYIAPDQSYLLFTRHGQPAGSIDLFISYKHGDGSWREAERLPEPINSESLDIYPVVSPDGRYLFFLSTRNGEFEIFWVDAGFVGEGAPRE